MELLEFELDFWDADGWFAQSSVKAALLEMDGRSNEHDGDITDSVSVFLHRRPPIDRVLAT